MFHGPAVPAKLAQNAPDALVAICAGLVEQYVDEQGQPAIRLTPDGERVARQLAMLGEDGQDALMAALLEEGG